MNIQSLFTRPFPWERFAACRLLAAGGLLALCVLLGCDGFQRSVCERELLSTCVRGSLPDAGSSGSLPAIKERRFERRASLGRSFSRSLVGMAGRRVVLGETPPPALTLLSYYDIALGHPDQDKRMVLGGTRDLSSLKRFFEPYYVVKSEPFYYVLEQDYGIIKFDIDNGGSGEIVSKCRLSRGLMRPFAHQQTNSLAAYCDGKSIAALFPDSTWQASTWLGESPPDALSMADFGDAELGQTLIVLGGGSVQLIGRAGRRVDGEIVQTLQAQLRSALHARWGGSEPVRAAYVADVNADPYPDMIFAQAGTVWGLSYRGAKWASQGAAFTVWSEPLVEPLSNEKVSALLLADLDLDAFPDMVIETDRAIHVYRSVER
jgi:hypothetical protein